MLAKPCPFCGMEINPNDPDLVYPSGIAWEDSNEGYRIYHRRCHQYPKENWCYNVVCNESYGGCGCTMSGDSKEEVLDKWNNRA